MDEVGKLVASDDNLSAGSARVSRGPALVRRLVAGDVSGGCGDG